MRRGGEEMNIWERMGGPRQAAVVRMKRKL